MQGDGIELSLSLRAAVRFSPSSLLQGKYENMVVHGDWRMAADYRGLAKQL